ncbi:hypothetical protein Tco_1052984, partial [Tanacetum coccineum]
TQTLVSSQNPDVDSLEENPVRMIPNPVGIVQAAKLHKQTDIHEGGDESILSTQEYIRKVVEDVGDDEDFKGGSWVSAVEFVNANGEDFAILEEEEMVELELQVGGNLTDQEEHKLRLDE